MNATPEEMSEQPKVSMLGEASDAFYRLDDSKAAVREAKLHLRDAEGHEKDAGVAVGKALRGLRHALNLSASDVARGAFAMWDPMNTLREYIELEDGQVFNENQAKRAFEYLKKRVESTK